MGIRAPLPAAAAAAAVTPEWIFVPYTTVLLPQLLFVLLAILRVLHLLGRRLGGTNDDLGFGDLGFLDLLDLVVMFGLAGGVLEQLLQLLLLFRWRFGGIIINVASAEARGGSNRSSHRLHLSIPSGCSARVPPPPPAEPIMGPVHGFACLDDNMAWWWCCCSSSFEQSNPLPLLTTWSDVMATVSVCLQYEVANNAMTQTLANGWKKDAWTKP